MLRFCLPLGLSLFLLAGAFANWPQWRGPDANGVAPKGEYPTEWAPDSHLDWKVKLPGKGSSTPIVWGKQVFVTCGINGQNTLLCYVKGQEQFRVALGEERAGKHNKATGSNPSCVTDGKHVYAYFKSGDLAAVELSGKVAWKINLQEKFGDDTLWWDLGTSPVLTKSAVVVACMQTGPSYLAAFSKETGDVQWKVDRMLDAPEEAAQSYSTPIVHEQDGRETIYVLGADHVTAHEGDSGREIWRVGGLNPTGQRFFRSIASPVLCDGVLIAPYARGGTLTAIKLGGKGDVTKSHVLWTKSLGADVPSPAAADGKVYVCTDKGRVVCLDGKTGNELWSGELEKNRQAYSSSPVLAGGYLYLTREDGKTFVLKQGNKFDPVGQNELKEMTVATPAFSDGRVYLRTLEHLYCVAK